MVTRCSSQEVVFGGQSRYAYFLAEYYCGVLRPFRLSSSLYRHWDSLNRFYTSCRRFITPCRRPARSACGYIVAVGSGSKPLDCRSLYAQRVNKIKIYLIVIDLSICAFGLYTRTSTDAHICPSLWYSAMNSLRCDTVFLWKHSASSPVYRRYPIFGRRLVSKTRHSG